jgi:sec-independent protein translocase protein TatA
MTDFFVLGAMVGPWQIVLIVVIILLLFGGKKIPDLMRGLGEGIKEFKKATSKEEEEKQDEETVKDSTRKG